MPELIFELNETAPNTMRSPTPKASCSSRWELDPLDLPSKRALRGIVTRAELREHALFRLLIFQTRPRRRLALDAEPQLRTNFRGPLSPDLLVTPINGRDLAVAFWARQITGRARRSIIRMNLILVSLITLEHLVFFAFGLSLNNQVQGVVAIMAMAGLLTPLAWSSAVRLLMVRSHAKTKLRAEKPPKGPLEFWKNAAALLFVLLLAAGPLILAPHLPRQPSPPPACPMISPLWIPVAAALGLGIGLGLEWIARGKFDANLAAATRYYELLLEAIRENGR